MARSPGFVFEDRVAPYLKKGQLKTVLEDWTPPFAGFQLYYPSRKQSSSAFSLVVEALRYRR
jgi:DNA-binding transcriptional LysR family regulator